MSATSTIAPIVKKRCWETINAISSREEEENGEEKQKVEPLVCVTDFECGKDENKLFEEHRVGWCFIGEKEVIRRQEPHWKCCKMSWLKR